MKLGRLAQLYRATVFGTVGRGLESLISRHFFLSTAHLIDQEKEFADTENSQGQQGVMSL